MSGLSGSAYRREQVRQQSCKSFNPANPDSDSVRINDEILRCAQNDMTVA